MIVETLVVLRILFKNKVNPIEINLNFAKSLFSLGMDSLHLEVLGRELKVALEIG